MLFVAPSRSKYDAFQSLLDVSDGYNKRNMPSFIVKCKVMIKMLLFCDDSHLDVMTWHDAVDNTANVTRICSLLITRHCLRKRLITRGWDHNKKFFGATLTHAMNLCKRITLYYGNQQTLIPFVADSRRVLPNLIMNYTKTIHCHTDTIITAIKCE